MKELMATARNIGFVVLGPDIEHGKLAQRIEVVLTVSEPSWRMDPGGGVSSTRRPETLRFATDPHGLRLLAKNCEDWAKESEAIAERIADGSMDVLEESG
uniref:Uncharacterized protein n=1 Tax=viral metagenome TaxID=1070528 RepID=A0A6M3LXB1_9ZZZZ